MTELAELYVLFGVIYLIECAVWVPRRATGLVATLLGWRARRPLRPNAGWARGVVFAGVLPPLQPAFVAEPLPFPIGPDGLVRDGAFVPWSEVKTVAAIDTHLEIDGQPAATLATRRGARALAEALAGLPRLSRERRATRLQTLLDARFDVTVVGQRLSELARHTRLLRATNNVLWIALFVGLPLVIWSPLVGLLLGLGALVLVAWVVGAIVFERILRRQQLLPRALWPDLTRRIVAASSPIAGVRSFDLLARELLGDLDPLAAAGPRLAPAALGALARPRLVDALHRSDEGPASGAADRAWWREQELARVRRLLLDHGVDAEALLAPPARDRADVVRWCPGCRAQYQAGAAEQGCPNEGCQGITPLAY